MLSSTFLPAGNPLWTKSLPRVGGRGAALWLPSPSGLARRRWHIVDQRLHHNQQASLTSSEVSSRTLRALRPTVTLFWVEKTWCFWREKSLCGGCDDLQMWRTQTLRSLLKNKHFTETRETLYCWCSWGHYFITWSNVVYISMDCDAKLLSNRTHRQTCLKSWTLFLLFLQIIIQTQTEWQLPCCITLTYHYTECLLQLLNSLLIWHVRSGCFSYFFMNKMHYYWSCSGCCFVDVVLNFFINKLHNYYSCYDCRFSS